jgi:alpha-galactosidase
MATATADAIKRDNTDAVTTKNADAQGHAAHTKAADTQEGLRGKITRPINITFLGAGSGFCPTLCKDVLLMPGADRGEFRLVDVDKDRLSTMQQVIQRLIADAGRADGWTVRASTDRRSALPGTDYAVCCVEVSGTACVAFDNDIPLKYGVDQCIGDTLGAGGLFKGLRTVPVFLDILRDIRELAPQAIMLNYTNPMSMLVLAAGRAVPEVPVVGLCHSVQGTSHLLASYAGVPYEEMEWECAGINHLAWFTKLRHQGKDLYSTVLYDKFRREIEEGVKEAEAGLAPHKTDEKWHWSEGKKNKTWKQGDLVRKDMCVQFGAFITESSGHLSEYLPYYRKNDEGRKLLRLGYEGGSRFYASNWPDWRKRADEHRMKLVAGEAKIELKRSWEYASWIIEAREKDTPVRIHGNVMNNAERAGQRGSGEGGKLITNLPGDGAVEVACMIDRNGINPTRYGALPAQMAAVCRSNMAYFDLAATACIERSKEAAVHALLLDPMTSAILSPREIRKMTYEMFDAEREFLPGYK